MEEYEPAVAHRNVYRGKNLGSAFTDEQKRVIREGTFDDVYVGDYWVDGNIVWRIADIDYFIGCYGSTTYKKHHIVVMPDKYLFTAPMHSTNSLESIGYLNSDMRKTTLLQAKQMVKMFFGEDCLPAESSCMYYMANSISTSYAGHVSQSVINASTDVDLPTIAMLRADEAPGFGGFYGPSRNNRGDRFAGAVMDPARFSQSTYFTEPTRPSIWTQNVTTSGFYALEPLGSVVMGYANNAAVGVRPYAIIEG